MKLEKLFTIKETPEKRAAREAFEVFIPEVNKILPEGKKVQTAAELADLMHDQEIQNPSRRSVLQNIFAGTTSGALLGYSGDLLTQAISRKKINDYRPGYLTELGGAALGSILFWLNPQNGEKTDTEFVQELKNKIKEKNPDMSAGDLEKYSQEDFAFLKELYSAYKKYKFTK